MKRLKGIAALLMATAALGACGSQADNQATTNEAATDGSVAADNSMAQMSGPFADAEMRMNEQMMAAVGSDVGQNWLKKMIVHHQGAIDMSRVVLDQNPTADVAKMARDTITKKGKEIEDLRKLVQDGAPDQRSAELYRPAMMDMHQKMMAASGSDISDTYLRKMLEHHRGAVAMSDVALANGVTGAIRSQVQKTTTSQQKEIDMVEAMLRGEPMTAAAPAASRPAPSATAEPAAPQAAAAKPIPAKPKPAPAKTEPASKPAASASDCLPEHRAAGHC
jgi:uncharacterized protein (DUF305 family)